MGVSHGSMLSCFLWGFTTDLRHSMRHSIWPITGLLWTLAFGACYERCRSHACDWSEKMCEQQCVIRRAQIKGHPWQEGPICFLGSEFYHYTMLYNVILIYNVILKCIFNLVSCNEERKSVCRCVVMHILVSPAMNSSTVLTKVRLWRNNEKNN